jgi:hypothetical protein
MLGTGCPDRHALPLTSPVAHRRRRSLPARAGSFFAAEQTIDAGLRVGTADFVCALADRLHFKKAALHIDPIKCHLIK